MSPLPVELDRILGIATRAFVETHNAEPAIRAGWLESMADGIDQHSDDLVPIAIEETHLSEGRLTGELKRTTFQLRLFADIVRAGGFLDARIDSSDPNWGMGPRPELRRVRRPMGPVIVFAASNFPFAFSVAGGDTTSALAAGCPVVVKAHEAHPMLSRRTAEIVMDSLSLAGAPQGVFALVEGRDAGVEVLRDPRIAAGGFTGSIAGGRALFDIAVARPVPIPFYAEMSSVNPVVITSNAATRRTDEIARGLAESMTLGVGQFCTKPGLVFVPRDHDIIRAIAAQPLPPVGPMLTERITHAYLEGAARIALHSGVAVIAGGVGGIDPVVFSTDMEHVDRDRDVLMAECFGPSTLLVQYDDLDSVRVLIDGMEGQLTGTLFAEFDDDVQALVETLARRVGRVIWNAWPTGVSVSYAQQHGGPYPATSLDTSTSVGTAAIDRWLRAVAYQGIPEHLLPPALQDANPWNVPQQRR